MTRARLVKTSFTAGELDPLLLGRLDLKAHEEGASRLRNVIVHPTGGVTRRPGTRYVATVPGGLRMVPFDGPDGGEILVFGHLRLDVVKQGAIVASITSGVHWETADVAALSWARLDDTLLVCHPRIPPVRLVRQDYNSWLLEPWRFDRKELVVAYEPSLEPFHKFAAQDVSISPQLASGTPVAAPVPAGTPIRLTASASVFKPLHYGLRLMLRGRQVRIFTVASGTEVDVLVLEDLLDGARTFDWKEQAFSDVRGFPTSVGFLQNRLVIGGSRDLPDQIWMSKTGRPFDFDLGTGLDDEAISFRLAAERRHVISSVFTGRQLQVFTDAGEWVVKGSPLTPSSIHVELQTSIGSYAARRIPPIDVDGATLFVGSTGRDLREFLFADTEQAYQAADLALLSRHLMQGPVDVAFDQGRRLLLVVRSDGKLAAVTLDRNSNVVAWTLLTTDGLFRAALNLGGQTWFLVERMGSVFVERLDESVTLDAAFTPAPAVTPRFGWTGFGHLEGRTVTVVADGSRIYERTVAGGQLTVSQAATTVTAGLGFTHEVEAPPLMAATARGLTPDLPYRPVRLTFRLFETSALTVDTGAGPRTLALPVMQPFSGDVAIRAIGWRRGTASPPWRVAQSAPLPCTILCVTTEIKVND